MPDRRPTTDARTRAGATAVTVVFVGLFVVTALLAGGFYVVVTGGADAGDPSKVQASSSRCTVTTDGDAAGVGEIKLSARYQGNDSVDLSEATLSYEDERHGATLSIARNASATAASVRNSSGAYDPTISRGERLTVVVDAAAIRGSPLPAGERANLELAVDGGTVSSTSVRVPGAVGPDQSFVDC